MKMAVVVAAGSLALAACSSSSSTTPAASTGASGAAQIKVGMAYDVGGRGDQSFNDAAAAGLDKAAKELGVASKEASASNGEAESARQERLQQLIDAGYTNIVAVGFDGGRGLVVVLIGAATAADAPGIQVIDGYWMGLSKRSLQVA